MLLFLITLEGSAFTPLAGLSVNAVSILNIAWHNKPLYILNEHITEAISAVFLGSQREYLLK
jgi:hypothetical protein